MPSIQRNIPLFKIDAFLGGLWPLSALAIVYFEQITHSYALAMLVWSISSIVQTLAEIPTSIFSDKIGRRKTLIVSTSCYTICYFFWALSGELSSSTLLFGGAIFWGLADALLSGTQDALMYETMEELDKKEEFAILCAKTNFWMQCGLAFSALFAAAVTYFLSLQTLAWICIVPISSQLVTAYFFIEPKRISAQKQVPSLIHFLIACKKMWRNKKLRFYACFTIFHEAVGYGYTCIESAYFQTLIKDWLINIMRFIKQLSGTIGFILVPHLKRFSSVKLFFTSVTINQILKTIGVALNNVFSPIVMSFVNLCWGISVVSKTDILQQEFSAQQRATMQSIIEVPKSILGALIMYLIGVLADVSSLRIAITTTIGLEIICLFWAMIVLKLRKTN